MRFLFFTYVSFYISQVIPGRKQALLISEYFYFVNQLSNRLTRCAYNSWGKKNKLQWKARSLLRERNEEEKTAIVNPPLANLFYNFFFKSSLHNMHLVIQTYTDEERAPRENRADAEFLG